MIRILDTTLRDGSYVVDFQFTSADTSAIAARLDNSGVHYIEVGHGLGLGAGVRPDMLQPEPDEAYLQAAANAVKKARWGMFFIPGIGTIEDIEKAARYGMGFIRVGTNVTEVATSEKYIRRAKELGMEVFANYMKTYAVSPEEVGRFAKISADFGADHVCVVDSAGGMLPEDVVAYIKAIKSSCEVSVGFHGHNNLGLAIANSLAAADAGASIIDTSVRGMGRSSGNTVTEIFLLTLKRKGIDLGINVTSILNLAEKHIDPLVKNYQQVDSIGIISGYAQFHSSFLGKVLKYAGEYRVDPRELIVRVTNVDRVNAPDELLKRLSEELAGEQSNDVERIELKLPVAGTDQQGLTGIADAARKAASEASSVGKKWFRTSVFNLVQPVRPGNKSFVSGAIHNGHNYIVASGEASGASDAGLMASAVDGLVDIIFCDTDLKNTDSADWIGAVRVAVRKSRLLEYSDTLAWAKTTVLLFQQLKSDRASAVCVYGKNNLAQRVKELLRGSLHTVVSDSDSLTDLTETILILCEPVSPAVDLRKEFKPVFVIDAWLGSLNTERSTELLAHQIPFYRIDMAPIVQAEITAASGMYNVVHVLAGSTEVNGIEIVSGGVIARRGAVVVDEFRSPSKVFGVADGRGFLIPKNELTGQDRENLERVNQYILTLAVN
jgi:4-hydroxy-2-oxovalerate aldolase